MALAIGVSHAGLTRVLNGQSPSGKLLSGLAAYGIDMQWVLAGSGAPTGARGMTLGGALHVSDVILPGSPQDHPELLSPLTMAAASPWALEEAYWYRVTRDSPVAKDNASGVRVGDYLLLESSARWTRRPEAYRGRIISLWIPQKECMALGKVDFELASYEPPDEHKVDAYGIAGGVRIYPTQSRGSAGWHPPERQTGGAEFTAVYSEDVRGVALLLVRLIDSTR
jgi:hypothetical protein